MRRIGCLIRSACIIALLPGLAACDGPAPWYLDDPGETAEVEAATGSPRSFARRPSPAQRLDQIGVGKAFMVEAPDTGVDLGWGWSTDREQPIPTRCIAFDTDQHDAQEVSVAISEVRDNQALSSAMNISSSVSVKSMGYEASGKAAFAKNTKITSFSTTYVVRADVRNGARYVAPRTSETGYLGASVALTEAAASLARRDLDAFEAACGEGFVSAEMTGAEAYAVIDIRTSSKSERETLKSKVSGSGWGVKVNAAFNATTEGTQEKAGTSITFYQAGGSGKELPRDKDAILERIESLADDATEAGKLYALEITPYQVLENFPRDAELMADPGETDEVAAAWALHRIVYDDIAAIFAEPARFEIPVADCSGALQPSECEVRFVPVDGDKAVAVDGGVTPLELLGIFQDIALMALDRVELGARDCLDADEHCAFDPTTLRSSYAVRTGLPLPKCWLRTATPAATQGNTADATGSAGVACTGGMPSEAQRIEAHTAFHLRDAARGRCAISSLEAGCISNAEINGWEARTGFVPLAAADQAAFSRATEVLDQESTPWLRGDPDRPDALILWIPAERLRAIETALEEPTLASEELGTYHEYAAMAQ
jgi:hypothetical protein